MKRSLCLPVTCLLLMVGSSLGEIIVNSRALLAMQNRTDEAVLWCEPFYSTDFPENSVCESKLDGMWDVFPACCNGAFNCLHGIVWDMVLCPAEHVYDFLAERCIPYNGVGCGTAPAPGDDFTTTEEPPLSCGNVRSGKLPYSADCTKYIKCTKSEPTLESCPTGYIFYIPFSACLPGELTHCALYQI
uniref:Uncharacterized protein n=1 Tax=Anopheles atroparvus TaxID=41427 RepID=A0A182IZL8_ANOAO